MMDFENIPIELRECQQWVCWSYKTRHGTSTKVPRNAMTGRMADSTDSTTWTTFKRAFDAAEARADFEGVGFVFSIEDKYAGVDLDDCIDANGEIMPEARTIIDTLNTYAEVSPSGKGVKLFARGKLPVDNTGRKTTKLKGFGAIEAYHFGRFFTVTGQRVEGTPAFVNDCQDGLTWLFKEYFGNRDGRGTSSGHGPTVRKPARSRFPSDDATLLDKARNAENGPKFAALYYQGDTSFYNGDDSAADQALCNILAFWTGGDSDRMDHLFRGSALMRDKWDERRGNRTYGQRTIDEAIRTTTEFYAPEHNGGNGSAETKPIIVCTNRQLCDKSNDALKALQQTNHPPTLYVRNGAFVHVGRDDERRPIVRPFSVDGFRRRLSEAARFVNKIKGNDSELVNKDCSPPLDLTRDVFGRVDDGFPVLVNIVEAPTLRPDGTLIDTPGYDESTGLLYVPANGASARIQDQPNQVAAIRSAQFLDDELLHDFPFADQASRANMIGTILTPLVRPMIDGRTPLGIVDATVAGTGKTLLVRSVSIIATGRDGGMLAAPTNPEEWSKTIAAGLDAGRTIMIFDNVAGVLRSPVLDLVITTNHWDCRILGTKNMASYRVEVTWMATGNNVQVGGDLPRRCYWIKLDPGTHRPETRTDFRHDDIIAWTKAHRIPLVNAVLTMARAWIGADRPKGDSPRIGSFEKWSEIIGGILTFSGVEGFLGNWEAEREAADTEGPQWRAFLEALHDAFSGNAFSVGEVEALIATDKQTDGPVNPELRAALSDFLEMTLAKKSFTRSLGWKFRAIRGRRFDDHGLRIEAEGEDRTGKRWRVLRDEE